MATLATPRGTKFRCTSKRRFLLVNEGVGYTGKAASLNRPTVMQRSDSLDTLRTVVRRQGLRDVVRRGAMADHVFIIDSLTGKAVPLRAPVPASVSQLREGDTIRLYGEGRTWQRVGHIERTGVSDWRVTLDGIAVWLHPQTTVRRLVRDNEITKG